MLALINFFMSSGSDMLALINFFYVNRFWYVGFE